MTDAANPPSPRAYPCVERTLDIYLGRFQIRLWIDSDEVELPDSSKAPSPVGLNFLSPAEIVEWYRKEVPRLNAIQIRERGLPGMDLSGVVVYLVDFSSDPRG